MHGRGITSADVASQSGDNAYLICEKRLRPEALATLRTNRSIDKMVKSYVRNPISNKNLLPKHMLYKPHVPSSSSTQHLEPLDHNILRKHSLNSSDSFLSASYLGTTDFVGIGVGGGEGVELGGFSRTSSHSRCTTPAGLESVGSGGDVSSNLLPDRPASPLQFIAQPNHNNGSPRSLKRLDNFLPIWNEISSPTDFPPAPGRIDIHGAQIPSALIKDGMIDLVRKHDTAQRKRFVEQKRQVEALAKPTGSDGSVAVASVITENTSKQDVIKFIKKGEIGFEDSFDSNIDDVIYGLDRSMSFSEASQQEIKSSKSYMDLTQKSKLSSITRIEDDYAAKWIKMKSKRDERREREIRRGARAQIMQAFSQVVYNTERNEIERALINKREESNESVSHKEEIKIRRREQEDSLRRRLESERNRKREEVKKIKQAIRSTMEMSSAIKANILSEKKEKVRESSFLLDDSSSSIVSIPTDLSMRLKTATSLKAYEAAKKEIKEFQESTLSHRFASLAKSREDAVSRVAALGSVPISLTPLKSAINFSDSITLQSDPSFFLPSASSKVSSAQSALSGVRPPLIKVNKEDPLEQQMTDSIGDDLSYASNSSISSGGSRRSLKSKESTRDRQFRELQEKFRQDELHAAANRRASQRVANDFEKKIEEFGWENGKKKVKKFHPDWPKKFQVFGDSA